MPTKRTSASRQAGKRVKLQLPASSFFPAWVFAAVYAVLLLCIPTRLIVGPIGAAGTPAALAAIAGLLWWCCAVFGGLNPRRGLSPMRVALALLTISTLASYIAGHMAGWYQPADIHQRTDRLWYAATASEVTATVVSAADRGLLALAGWVGIALITSEGIRSWRELERAITWIVAAASFVASLGIVQYFTGISLARYLQIPGLTPWSNFGATFSRSMLNRVVSTSTHPIELGVIMAAILPLALHRSLHATRRTAWIPTLLIGVTALMSVSRSAIIVAGVALIVMFAGWPNRWRLAALIAAPIAAVVGRIALPGLLGTIRSLFTGLEHDPSIAGRTADYSLVFRLVGERPVFGQGLFTFIPMLYRTLDNQALVLLLELGVVGTLAFVGLLAVGLHNAWAPRRFGKEAQHRHLGLAVAASLTGLVTSYITFDALGFRQVAGLTFLLLGLGGAIWHLARDPLSPHLSPHSALLASPAKGHPTDSVS
jgi:polysaccharide biosynthesis protein PslJ